MKILRGTTRASGVPVSPSAPAVDKHQPLTIVRVRHEGGEVEFGGDETVCLSMSLSDTQRVERFRGGAWSRRQCGVGLVSVADPEELARYAVRGNADVLLLFLPVEELARTAGSDGSYSVPARFLELDPDLKRCAHRAFVMVHDGDGSDALLLSSIAHQLARRA